MKKIVIAIIIALLLCAVIPYTVGADTSQTWYLYNNGVMYKGDTSKDAGSFLISSSGGSNTWIADEVVTTDVTFPNDTWTGQLVFTSAPGNNSIKVEMGDSSGLDFVPADPAVEATIGDGSSTTLAFETSAASFTVPSGKYLALRITNNDTSNRSVTTGGASSYTSSPSASPAYPIPELSTIILLGSGLAGLAGYLFLKRRKKSYARV